MAKIIQKKSAVTAYKVFEPDWKCRGFQFEVGKTFKHEGRVEICSSGFHACLQAADCFSYYGFDPNNKVAEVLLWGDVDERENGDDTKICARNIQIVREIDWQEVLNLVNTGKACTGLKNSGNRNSGNRNSGDWNSGDCNSGDRNSGDCNSGDCNSGNRNSGDRNSGDCNSGDCNSGNRNSGDCNSGDWNSGDRNSGDWNSGDRNSGDCNSGDRNSGNRNSGDRNSGDCNSGNRNSGDWNSGDGNQRFFCTENQPVYLFDLPTDKNISEITLPSGWNYDNALWVFADHMTDEEKQNFTHYETTGGYLKTFSYKEMCRNGWAKDADENKLRFFNLPNFNLEKFEQITGIDAKADYERLVK